MALRIELPTGQVMLIDELTGDIVGMEQPTPPVGPGPNYPPHGGLAGPSGVGGTTTTTSAGPLPPPPGVVGAGATTAAPPGYIWVQDPIDGTLKLVTDRTFRGDDALSPNTLFTQQQQNLRQQETLAEQIRQFNENFGASKAQFTIEQTERERAARAREGFDREQLDVRRGETLLQLGSRPDTLIRYLHAIRGQQAPQGLGTPPALPGFGAAPTTAVSRLTTSPVAAPASSAPARPAAPPPTPAASLPPANLPSIIQNPTALQNIQQTVQSTGAQPVAAQSNQTVSGITPQKPVAFPDGTVVYKADTATSHGSNNYFESLPATNPSSSQYAQPTASASPIVEPRPAPAISNTSGYVPQGAGPISLAAGFGFDKNGNVIKLERGGVIPEPVMGMGMDSGQTYMLGEESHRGVREVVVPEDKVPKDIFERLMKDAEEVDYSETKDGKRQVKVKRNSYAEGGPLGYKPIDPKVFNPPAISNDFNFPQIGNFTGGTSLVPSAQRLFESLPSERALYSGYLRDEVGVQSEDVFEMARRLAPKVTGLSSGRFVN